VNGTGFVSGSTINWNGSPLATTFVNSSQLTAVIPAGNIVAPNTASVTVVSPAPGGGTSSVVFFPVATAEANIAVSTSAITVGLQLPSSFLEGDFNSDGKPDLIAMDSSVNGEAQFIQGNGDGTFSTPQPPFSASYGLVLTGDFNDDSKLDFLVSDHGTFVFRVFLGNGDGTFSEVDTNLAAQGSNTISYTLAGDFNGDGKLDLACYCGNNQANDIQVLLGNGDGTFQPLLAVPTSVPLAPEAAGDFNGDNKLDLVVLGGNGSLGVAGTMEILLGNGDGTFTQGQGYVLPQGLRPSGAVAADFNGDGKLDLAIAEYNVNVSLGATELLVFLGNGDGTFQTPTTYDVNLPGGPESAPGVGDFNGDGKLDIAASLWSSTAQGLVIFFGNGDGTFQQSTVFSELNELNIGGTFAIGDFNGDGRLDFVPALTTGTSSQFGLWSIVPASAPTVELSPSSLVFGQLATGSTSAPQTTVLTNQGSQTLTISGVAITGANAGDFAQNNNCGTTLASNASCQINVTFTPTANGVRTASVSISDNAPGSPQTLSLTGNPPISGITLSPSSVSFPSQYVGTAGLPQTLTLTNAGSSTLTITSVTATPTDFGVVNACGSSVAPGTNCSIAVFFDPTVSGTRAGTLTVVDTATTSPQTVSLTGVGQDFSMAPQSQSSSTVSPGQTANYTVALSPVGGFNQTVTLSCAGAPAGSVCSVPSSVTLNGTASAPITVTVMTTASASLRTWGNCWGGRRELALWVLGFGLSGVVILGSGRRKRRAARSHWLRGVALLGLIAMGAGLSGCGGNSRSAASAQPNTYNLTVTGTFTSGSTTLTHDSKLTLIVQ
jgi:hypothetical protein